jgi:hypothetical protein
MEKGSLVHEIYKTSEEDLSHVAEEAIHNVVHLLEKYANEIVKDTDIVNNRWILINLFHVLYKYVFLLQTEDLEMIGSAHPKKLSPDLSNKCIMCNRNLSSALEQSGLSEEEKTKGVCLDCFIAKVHEGDWWKQTWISIDDGIKK